MQLELFTSLGVITGILSLFGKQNASYSRINLIFTLYSFLMKKYIFMPFCLCNTMGILVSFNAGRLFFSECFKKLFEGRESIGVVYDIFIHITPLIISIIGTKKLRSKQSDNIIVFSGLYSCLSHFLWALVVVRSFNLSSIYTEMPNECWRKLWNFAVIGHLSGMFISNKLIK